MNFLNFEFFFFFFFSFFIIVDDGLLIKIVHGIDRLLQGESKEHYEFVNPVIEGISPAQGPRSGGTLLTIRGQYMNAGSSIQVTTSFPTFQSTFKPTSKLTYSTSNWF